MVRALALAALMLASLGAGVARAAPQALTRSSGAVTATLSYEQGADSFGNPTYSQERLRIVRGGASLYEEPVRSAACSPECALETFGGGPLQVSDLEGSGQPEVILDLNTGGAHCCTIVQVFSFDPGVMSYRPVERDFGDPSAPLLDVAGDGRLEFESADDRFAYAFTSFAYSGLPLQIWRLRAGRFVDATKAFPKALAADAASQFRQFTANANQGLGLGFIAAWAADEDLLGRRALVSRTLAREARRHRLRSGDHLSPGGSAFVAKLGRFLKRTGYR